MGEKKVSCDQLSRSIMLKLDFCKHSNITVDFNLNLLGQKSTSESL